MHSSRASPNCLHETPACLLDVGATDPQHQCNVSQLNVCAPCSAPTEHRLFPEIDVHDRSVTVEAQTSPDRTTSRWLVALALIAATNIALWVALAFSHAPKTPYGRTQLMLSAVFVLVCAFRSLFPRVDLERRCVWDSHLSGIFVGRTAATVAEICFALQCQLFVSKLAGYAHDPSLHVVAVMLVPLVVIAEMFCWYAVLRLNPFGHAVEEGLWTILIILVASAVGGAWWHARGGFGLVLAFGILACVGAAALTGLVDVPMYLARWQRYRSEGQPYLQLSTGLADSVSRRHASGSWRVWRPEAAWMTLYFSGGVWISLGLVLFEHLG